MTGRLRIALLTPDYPPWPGPVGDAAAQLARSLDRAGAEVVVFTVHHNEPPAPPAPDDRVRVYRISSPLEGLALLDLEETARPFTVLHGLTWRAASLSLMLPAPPRRLVVLTLWPADSADLDARAVPILQRADWVVSTRCDVLDRARRLHDSGPCAILLDDDAACDASAYAPLYAGRGTP